ncbi:glycosyltransferase family 2 protein [Pedobacter sp. SD-b]|uniref:Glycosyltransferase family 2 protein n=1 Tax=Pedobacter segetis TaxID=2793069 RepID=A0ABS1BG09_9SPHI|nr:glycosyltransferase family 2 protein [Pedobacter segetis]MBK0381800.1 glycosyltransferase family 2 protein [Pedobacter segetis]
MLIDNKQPLVSVIIPTFNRGYVLHKTIESVLNQTYKNIEIIVVDDGSTDNTKKVVSTFGNKLFYIQKSHSGQGDTRNLGLQYAKGEIIAPLDSDDTLNEDFLEKSVDYMLDHNLDMFFSNFIHCFSKKNLKNELSYLSKNKKISNNEFYLFDYQEFRTVLFKESPSPSSSSIIQKKCIPFGWNPKVNIGDDMFLLFEMMFKNADCRVGFTNQVLWRKNVDNSNICDNRKGAEFRKLHIQDLQLLLHTFESYMNDFERKTLNLKILQNKMLVAYYLFFEKNNSKELKKLCKEIFANPSLLFVALKEGVTKVIRRRIL